jgi:hypothetical protein
MQQMNAEARYSIWNALESAMKLRPMMLLLMLLISMGVSAQRRKQHRQKVAPPTEQSEQMKRMTESTQRIMFIDSVVLPKKDILKAYPVSAEVGRLAPYSSFFPQSKSQTLTYMNELGNRCLYNDTDSTLAYRERLLQTWSPADTLAGINSDHQFRHIRYPFMMTDGITLYFAAQGEGSIGGYDICASLQIALIDIPNHIRARQVEGIIVTLHLTRHFFETAFPKVQFLKSVLLDDGSHSAIQHEYTFLYFFSYHL